MLELVERLCDAVIWMSGLTAIEGDALEGWVKIREGALAEGLAACCPAAVPPEAT